jgi:hypothetical protein
MAMQRLGGLERKILKTNAVINRSLLHRERIQLGVDATMKVEHSVQMADLVLPALVALSAVILATLQASSFMA